jgi:hypothetical protein
MAAAKDQRPGAIEAGKHGDGESAAGRQEERRSQQDHEEDCGHSGARAGDRRCKRRPVLRCLFCFSHQEQAGECTCSDGKHGGIDGRCEERNQGAEQSDREAKGVRRERPLHADDCLGHDGDSDQLQTVKGRGGCSAL